MQYLAEAEEKIRQMKAAALAAAKKRVSDARLNGETMLDEALKKADREIEPMYAKADEEAKMSASSLAGKSESDKAGMRAAAEQKMPEAVSFIVERIVKS